MPSLTPSIPAHPTITILDSTKLSAFQTCPRRFLFEYVMGWRPESPSIHLTFGICWHLAMDYLLENGCSPDTATRAYEIFLARWREDIPEQQDTLFEPKDPATACAALLAYAQTYTVERFRVVHTEIPGTITVGDPFDPDWTRSLSVNIDSLVELPDGRLAFLDHKTTTQDSFMWRNSFTLSLPVGAYVHALYGLAHPSDVFGGIINGAILRKPSARGKGPGFLRLNLERTYDQQEAWLDEVAHLYRDLERNLDSLFSTDWENQPTLAAFPRNSGSCVKYGSLCPYHAFCTSVRNPVTLADTYDPTDAPPGFVREYWNPQTHAGERPQGVVTGATDAEMDNLLEKLA